MDKVIPPALKYLFKIILQESSDWQDLLTTLNLDETQKWKFLAFRDMMVQEMRVVKQQFAATKT